MKSGNRRTSGDHQQHTRLETGIDIVEIDRIERIVDRYGETFLDRVFTEGELRQSRGKSQSLAARFAAKEATFKALGAQVGWRQVEVVRDGSGKPRLVLHDRAREKAEQLGLRSWALSLSHSGKYAVAVVVATD